MIEHSHCPLTVCQTVKPSGKLSAQAPICSALLGALAAIINSTARLLTPDSQQQRGSGAGLQLLISSGGQQAGPTCQKAAAGQQAPAATAEQQAAAVAPRPASAQCAYARPGVTGGADACIDFGQTQCATAVVVPAEHGGDVAGAAEDGAPGCQQQPSPELLLLNLARMQCVHRLLVAMQVVLETLEQREALGSGRGLGSGGGTRERSGNSISSCGGDGGSSGGGSGNGNAELGLLRWHGMLLLRSDGLIRVLQQEVVQLYGRLLETVVGAAIDCVAWGAVRKAIKGAAGSSAAERMWRVQLLGLMHVARQAVAPGKAAEVVGEVRRFILCGFGCLCPWLRKSAATCDDPKGGGVSGLAKPSACEYRITRP